MRTVKRNIEHQTEIVHDRQNQIGSGKRINKPSDDPLGAMRTQQMYGSVNRLDQYERNHSFSKVWLSETESSITQAQDIVMRMKELAVYIGSDQHNAQTRDNVSGEVQQMRDHMLALANTTVGGRHIFSGHETDRPAFLTDGTYAGDDGKIYINLDNDVHLNMNFNGDDVFQSTAGGKNIIDTLEDFVSALQANDDNTIRTTIIDELDYSFDIFGKQIADVGARTKSLETAGEATVDSKVITKEQIGIIEEVDYFEAVSEMEAARTAFQAALQSSARIGKLSLVNFI
jgi:flagellar hook-associated protein 3 FlgL